MSDLRKLDHPHAKAICKDGSAWLVPAESHDSVLAAWMGGKAFWTGVGVFGEALAIKLADITGVSLWSTDALAEWDADKALQKALDMLDGAK